MGKKETNILELGKLFNSTHKLLYREFNHKIHEVFPDLGFSEIRVLMELKINKLGLKQIELANLLCIRPISLSKLIDKLECMGLVKRINVKNDRRSKIIQLNTKAKDLEKMFSVMTTIGSITLEKAFKGASSEELAIFNKVLATIKNNFG